MLFIREIKYLYYYEKSRKCCSAGTCKCQIREGKMLLDVCLKKLPVFYPLQVKMYFTSGMGNRLIEQKCTFAQEKQEYRFIFPYPLETVDCEKLYIFFQVGLDKVICDEKTLFEYVSRRTTMPREQNMQGQRNENNAVEDREKEPVVRAASGQSLAHIPDLSGQKEKYYVVEPKQLGRFGTAFSQYEDNSFLLHGYYNYRHILVGPAWGNPAGTMRIGVPGNYYKREEVVAKMFGFLNFVPAKGDVKTGTFGYYYTGELPPEGKEKMR